MKTIMIPSDFSHESILTSESIVRNMDEDVKIVFTHFFHIADDIQDLLFSNTRDKEYELVSEDFWSDCKVLKDGYSEKLISIRIDFFYGNKLAALRNFLEYHDVNFIAYSENHGFPKLNKTSMDAFPILQKAGITMINTDLIHTAEQTDTQGISISRNTERDLEQMMQEEQRNV
ncbi:hypothetical protein [Dyadobacter luticola]|uniref:hypothetical protein n=1 Tax=Dyadobacter luticola TaxID=1979387 RepID=UPI00197A7CD7|nr:hypothetical protein [Dyadobacter luticola]